MHLSKRSGYYYFRQRVPVDLQGVLGRTEVKKSLKTKRYSDASNLVRVFSYRLGKFFMLLRTGVLTSEQVENWARISLQGQLKGIQESEAELYPLAHLLGNAAIEERSPRVADAVPESLDRKEVGGRSIDGGVMLSKLIGKYVQDHVVNGAWTTKTQQENEASYALILEVVEDTPVKNLVYDDFLEMKKKLSKLPSNRNKLERYKDRTVDEILKMEGVKAITTRTLNKHLVKAASLFRWAKKRGYVQNNPCEGLTVPIGKRSASKERESYTPKELRRIAELLPRDTRKPERFWIPFVAMFSGMRLNEICQLHVEDVVQVDGISCFDVNTREDGKRVKTDAGLRLVPIHPLLIEAGFLRYVARLKRVGSRRLWTNLKLGRDGYGDAFGKWFQRFNRGNITGNSKKVFHSLRHNFTDCLKQREVDGSVISALVGHAEELLLWGGTVKLISHISF